MRQVRCIPNTIDANAKMVGNDGADIIAGKDFFDSCSSFTRSQSTSSHGTPPFIECVGDASKQSAPQCGAVKKSSCCCNSTTGLKARASCKRRPSDACEWVGHLLTNCRLKAAG